jgi:hypothetical protein
MNSGKVQLDVVLKGKDEVTAILAQVEKQAKDTEKQLSKMSESESSIGRTNGPAKLGAALEQADDAINKASQGLEKFNKVLGIAGFVGGIVAAIPAVVDFVNSIISSKSAVNGTIEALKSLRDITKEVRTTLDAIELRRAPNEAAKEAVSLQHEQRDLIEQQVKLGLTKINGEVNVAKLQKQRNDLAKDIAKQEKLSEDSVLNFQTAQVEIIVGKRNIDLMDKLIKRTQDEINIARDGEKKIAKELVLLEQDRKSALALSAQQIEENKRKLQEFLYLTTFGIKGVKPAEPKPETKPEPKPPGGISLRTETATDFDIQMDAWTKELGRKFGITEEEWTTRRVNLRIETDVALGKAFEKIDAEDKARIENIKKTNEALDAREDQEEFGAILADNVQLFDEYKDSIYSAADAFDTLATSLGKSLDLFPEIGDGFRGVQEAMKRHAEFTKANEEKVAQGFLSSADAITLGEESKTKAIISGSTEGLAAIGKLIGGLKVEYALRSAGELAMGFATLANPVESAGHFVAAGLFAVAAGKAAASGGGGAGAAGADKEAPATSSSMGYGDGGGGQRTVVYNFSTLLADRQQVHRAIRDSELVGARNGYGRRRGV